MKKRAITETHEATCSQCIYSTRVDYPNGEQWFCCLTPHPLEKTSEMFCGQGKWFVYLTYYKLLSYEELFLERYPIDTLDMLKRQEEERKRNMPKPD